MEDPRELTIFQEYWPVIVTAVGAAVGWGLAIWQFTVNRRLKEHQQRTQDYHDKEATLKMLRDEEIDPHQKAKWGRMLKETRQEHIAYLDTSYLMREATSGIIILKNLRTRSTEELDLDGNDD